MFKNKTLLITGGTGTFGNAVLQTFLDTGIKEIRIFSRDEKKQDDMRKEYVKRSERALGYGMQVTRDDWVVEQNRGLFCELGVLES